MSTYFVPDRPLPFEALRTFDSRGVRTDSVYAGSVVLADGCGNFLRAYPANPTDPVTFERCGANDPNRIVDELEAAFGVRLVSEYEDLYESVRRRHRARERGKSKRKRGTT